jgi:dipeptidyl aminopeptidase/acylaminoacyl peptidase
MARPARPDDLYRFRIPLEPRLSPDGSRIVFTLQTVASTYDGYRHAIWSVPADGPTDGAGEARRLTIGTKHDRHGRFSPDGRTLAFISDRRLAVEDVPAGVKPDAREDGDQVHLLPLDGGEARRLTDLPRGVDGFAWSPDGRRLVVLTSSLGPTREADARARRRGRERKPTEPPRSDYRYIDRLAYQFNGRGFIDDRDTHLWLVDAGTGEARRLTSGPNAEGSPVWSPDGRRIAFTTSRRPSADYRYRGEIWVVDSRTGRETLVATGDADFIAPTWTTDSREIICLGHRYPAGGASRYDVWRFAADGSEARTGRNVTARHDRLFASVMNSDIVPGEEPRLVPTADGSGVLAIGPSDGAEELWRISLSDGDLEQVTTTRGYVSSFDAVAGPRGSTRIAYLHSSATKTSDVVRLDLPAAGGSGRARRSTARPVDQRTHLNDTVLRDIRLVAPEERWVEVEGRRIQGWLYPALPSGGGRPRRGPGPLVTQIHGGPHTHYGEGPMWEFQVLAGAGIAVFASNPRGSDGYTQAFNHANYRDWGDGPTRDVVAGIEALVADGRADPGRLGLTGGSYGGYLTNWIIARDHRFRAAVTCRSVTDMTTLMLTGDIASGDWARMEFGVAPWEDDAYYREISPLTRAHEIRTPLLIQHAENDIRTTVAQAEALFTVLRSLRRPVRFMRVPGETHELTRSGAPFRRVENMVQVRDWFRWFLVDGKRRLPPKPRERAGR